MTNPIETRESEALRRTPRGSAAAMPAQPALTVGEPILDEFKGDETYRVRCIQALLEHAPVRFEEIEVSA
ncbi:hypothetical protein D3C87_1379010 [compost metagenome]